MNSLKASSSRGLRFWTTWFSVLTLFVIQFVSVPKTHAISELLTSAVVIPGSILEKYYLSNQNETWIEEGSRRSSGFFEYSIPLKGKAPVLLELDASGSFTLEGSFAGDQLKTLFQSALIDEPIKNRMKRQIKIDVQDNNLVLRFSKKKGSNKPFALWRLFVRRGLDLFCGTQTELSMIEGSTSTYLVEGGGRKMPIGSSITYRIDSVTGFVAAVVEADGEIEIKITSTSFSKDLSLIKVGETYFGNIDIDWVDEPRFVIKALKETKIIRISLWFDFNLDVTSELGKYFCDKTDNLGIPLGSKPVEVKLPKHKNGYFWCVVDEPRKLDFDGKAAIYCKGVVLAKLDDDVKDLSIKGSGYLYSFGIDQDSDDDGVLNTIELAMGSNPDKDNSDDDNLNDFEDPMPMDSDNDGLNDITELFLETNPVNFDSDKNGYIDGLGLGNPIQYDLCARIDENPWPGAKYQDVTDPNLFKLATRYGQVSLVIPFGEILLERDPISTIKVWFEKTNGASGVLLDDCFISLFDMNRPEMIDAFQVWAKRLWGDVYMDYSLAYKVGEFICYRINLILGEVKKLALEKNLKVAISIPSQTSGKICPYKDFKGFDRIIIKPLKTLSFLAGFMDATMIDEPLFVEVVDEKFLPDQKEINYGDDNSYIAGVKYAGLFRGCSTSIQRPLIFWDTSTDFKPNLAEITTNSTHWSSILDPSKKGILNNFATLFNNRILSSRCSVKTLGNFKFAFINDALSFPTQDEVQQIIQWVRNGGNLIVFRGETEFKNELWWGPRTTLDQVIADSFDIRDVKLGNINMTGQGRLLVANENHEVEAIELLFDETHENILKPPCKFCESSEDLLELSFSGSRLLAKDNFPKTDYPLTVRVEPNKAPYVVSATCTVPMVEQRDNRIRLLAQAPRGSASSFMLSLGGQPVSITSSSSFTYSAQSGLVNISFVGSGGGNAFALDMIEDLDLALRNLVADPSEITEGESITVKVIVENRSLIASGPFSVSFHWVEPTRQNQFRREFVEGLPPKGYKEISFLAPIQPGYGQRKIYAVIDSEELNRANNTSSFTLTIHEKPIFKTIIMQIGNKIGTIDGEPFNLDAAPYQVKNGRVMVPFRFLAEALGAKVYWNDTERMITFERSDLKLFFWIGRFYAIVNGEMVVLDAPPEIRSNRAFVPVRFVSENIKAEVSWDGNNKIVTVKQRAK